MSCHVMSCQVLTCPDISLKIVGIYKIYRDRLGHPWVPKYYKNIIKVLNAQSKNKNVINLYLLFI